MRIVVLFMITVAFTGCLPTQSTTPGATIAPIAGPAITPTPSPTPAPTATPTPAPTATPSPTPTASPTPTPFMSSTYDGSWTCNINTEWTVGGTSCTDTATQTTTVINLPYGTFNILVGNDVACAYSGSGAQTVLPTNCASDSGCNAPTNYSVFCWTKTNPTPTMISLDSELGYSNSYTGGPLSYHTTTGTSPNGQICIEWSVYSNSTSDLVDNPTDTGTCGTTVNAGGYLQ